MENNISTVSFRSNLYPVRADMSFYDNRTFLSKIHDPFSLETLNKRGKLTDLQRDEYNRASVHCKYAAENDYPWGTVRDDQGHERVVCRCLNIQCRYFNECRPDFDPTELEIHNENQKARPAIFEFEEIARKKFVKDTGDAETASKLFAVDKLEENQGGGESAPTLVEEKPDPDNPFIVQKSVPQVFKPVGIRKIDFDSFVETTQTEIIAAEPVERSIVNAGPGTGKTWTLIEKIIHMINEKLAEAENILVLCFSRSAVEVVRSRLHDAAEAGRIGYEWQSVDVRTFDSFATYMLAWIQDNHKKLLPSPFVLETCDYDQRIKIATSIFKQKEDMLADYEHIIVDEVQDLVGSRAELVLTMLKGLPVTCGFTILGDSCQSLYDYMSEQDPSVMSSEQFYQDIFKSFPEANYFSLTENHRQDDTFGQMTIPYRKAILTGSVQDRISAAGDLLDQIPQLPVKLARFSRDDARKYVRQGGTLGILTRTNSQALQISAWLQNNEVPHSLHRGYSSYALGDWIACVFCDYGNESIDEAAFVKKYFNVFPKTEYGTVQMRWGALVSTQPGGTRSRYEVADLLKGLLRNAKETMLYESGTDSQYSIMVSNIHRAKGKEFDSVIVIDDVIEAMTCPDTETRLEHKVCYVALTRPRKNIERAELSQKDKMVYITRNEDGSKRCSKANIKRTITHFEVGNDTDVDMNSFAADKNLQQYIRENAHSGMRLKLVKCREGTKPYVVYRIVPEDNETMILGYTSKSFAYELEKAIRHIKKINCNVFYKLYPLAFCDVYIHKITTYVSGIAPFPAGATIFGDVGVWSGISIAGFATNDSNTY